MTKNNNNTGKTTADRLLRAIEDYLQWMKDTGYPESAVQSRNQTLMEFFCFVIDKQLSWEKVFTLETFSSFQGRSPSTSVQQSLKALAKYLFEHKEIDKPLLQIHPLPQLYEQYLRYYEQTHEDSCGNLTNIRRILFLFHQHLQKSKLQLSRLSIAQADAFLGKFLAGYSRASCRLYRTYFRGFLRYLYRPCGILKRDIALLVVGPPHFDRAKPPRFLRPDEIKKLFDDLGTKLSTAKDLRNYAMVHLAYTMGLRPGEISLIKLDDISFIDRQLRLPRRKNAQPVTLPVPEETLKAIAAFLVGGRPKSNSRRLFLNLKPPLRPISANTVTRYISKCMKDLGLPASGYWLRHSYAQNLLEAGRSIYEIKEMLGHEHIETTRKYLSVHSTLMREVLFDETL